MLKQSKTIVIILLIVLMVFGWLGLFLDDNSEEEKKYKSHLTLAEEYVERGLYQKSIEQYNAAIAIKSSEEVWSMILNSYRNRYEESTKIYDDYLKAAQQASTYYPFNVDFAKNVVELYLKRDEYIEAYKFLNKAIENGLEGEGITELFKKLKYSYSLQWKTFDDFRSFVNGYYAVSESGVWTYIELDGTDTDFEKLSYASSVGQDGIRVIYENEKGQLIDTSEVVQGLFDFQPESTGVYSEGLVAIMKNGIYSYYNSLGDEQFGNYVDASAYCDGRAAVKSSKWIVIDQEGKEIGKSEYDDIVLNQDYSYIKNGIMIAKKGSEYHLYDSNEKQIGDFACEDIDCVTNDNLIAFSKDGKWGYIDEKGKEVIKPIYNKAKSFSNGLAAVSNGEKWGFIDKEGELVIDYSFFDVDYFNEKGFCMVETGTNSWQLLSLYITK